MKTMNLILVVIGITTGVFVVIQMAFFFLTGSYMEEMTRMWFTYILGESGCMGVIQAVKTIAMNNEMKQKKIEEEKKELAKMAENEAGK